MDLLPPDFPPSLYGGELKNRFATERNIHGTLQRIQSKAFRFGVQFYRTVIGQSRGGLDLFGLVIGNGPSHVSITAGAHADEPAGPMTALALAEWLVESPAAKPSIADYTFYICPNVNPDGAEANSVWFADPVDPFNYFRDVIRELPGDDVEFGYPDPKRPETRTKVRPENLAAANFISAGAPYVFHASLHGMSFAEGAWFLIGKEWVNRTAALRTTLVHACESAALPLHDIERHGEKGFTRIAPGFCTTPTSNAMKEHFLANNDPAMAEKFHLSSMEYVQALGGDPLVMVSEMPLFMIGDESTRSQRQDPPAENTLYQSFRPRLAEIRAHLIAGDEGSARQVMESVSLQPVPFRVQMIMQMQMILAGISAAKGAT